VKSVDDTSNFEDYGELLPLVSDVALTEEEQEVFKGF
jgi:hypothetical protein